LNRKAVRGAVLVQLCPPRFSCASSFLAAQLSPFVSEQQEKCEAKKENCSAYDDDKFHWL